MSKNYLRLVVGEKTISLKFNIGTLKAINELTGVDPFQYKASSEDFADLMPYAKVIFHAAIISNYRSKKQDIDFTEEDVSVWFDDLSATDVVEIIRIYNNPESSKPSVNGEVGKDTQPAAIL